jgi:hypothetical protein
MGILLQDNSIAINNVSNNGNQQDSTVHGYTNLVLLGNVVTKQDNLTAAITNREISRNSELLFFHLNRDLKTPFHPPLSHEAKR